MKFTDPISWNTHGHATIIFMGYKWVVSMIYHNSPTPLVIMIRFYVKLKSICDNCNLDIVQLC